MITAEQIPDEVVEAADRAFGTWDRNAIRDAIAAALNAWPKAEYGSDDFERLRTALLFAREDEYIAKAANGILSRENEVLKAALQYYAVTFCELGPCNESCGKLNADTCSGCLARATLNPSSSPASS